MTMTPDFINTVSETLLITLYARALESRRSDGLIKDEVAEHLVEQLDYDFKPFDKKLTQTAVAVRVRHFDDVASRFIQQHPEAYIISLGSGLDTRNHRLCAKGVTARCFIDVDFPDVISAREQLLPVHQNNRCIASSALDTRWMQALSQELFQGRSQERSQERSPQPASTDYHPILIMAEGLFMYLSHGQIEALLDDLQAHFPGAELLFDATVPWYCKIKQETVRHTDAAFVSGIRHAGRFALKHDLTLLHEDNIWHLQRARWGWLGRCAQHVAPLRDIHRFLHFRFKARA